MVICTFYWHSTVSAIAEVFWTILILLAGKVSFTFCSPLMHSLLLFLVSAVREGRTHWRSVCRNPVLRQHEEKKSELCSYMLWVCTQGRWIALQNQFSWVFQELHLETSFKYVAFLECNFKLCRAQLLVFHKTLAFEIGLYYTILTAESCGCYVVLLPGIAPAWLSPHHKTKKATVGCICVQ